MIKYWVFTQGGAWRNLKPTGNPYICEQCRLDARSKSNPILTLQAVTTIELAPKRRMRRLRGEVVGRTEVQRARRNPMIRKKWRDGEGVLSIETEDEFWKALATGEAVEVTRELADQLGMMEDDTITWAEAKAAKDDPSD